MASGAIQRRALPHFAFCPRASACGTYPIMTFFRSALRPALTLIVAAGALVMGWWMWCTYMLSPWTRDGTVRVYVVTIAPEVAGRVVQLNAAANQYVHNGDLLFVIDPSDYQIAVDEAQAVVDEAKDRMNLARTEAERRVKLSELAVSIEQQQIYAVGAAAAARRHSST